MSRLEKNIKTICTYVVVLLPILGTYGLMSRSVTFADISIIAVLAMIMIVSLLKHKIAISNKKLLLFTLWIAFSTTLSIFLVDGVFSTITILQLIKNFIYSLALLLIPNGFFDLDKSKKIYTNIVIILCILVFVQFALYLITGTFKPWVINSPYLPAIYVNDDYFTEGYLYMLGGGSFRPSSIFSEPALFAQYVAPCLIINMFDKKSVKKNIVIFLITISTILGKSANGMIYIIVIWAFYLFYYLFEFIKNKKKKIKKYSILILAGSVIASPLVIPKAIEAIGGDNSHSLLNRLSEITDTSGETSGSMRIVRGWKIFYGLETVEKIFGIGVGNIVNYLNIHPNIVTMFRESYNGYMSGLSAIFVNCGIIGGIIYMSWWISEMKNNNLIKSLLVFLLLYLIASNSFMSGQFVLTTIIILTHSNNNRIKKEDAKKGKI